MCVGQGGASQKGRAKLGSQRGLTEQSVEAGGRRESKKWEKST